MCGPLGHLSTLPSTQPVNIEICNCSWHVFMHACMGHQLTKPHTHPPTHSTIFTPSRKSHLHPSIHPHPVEAAIWNWNLHVWHVCMHVCLSGPLKHPPCWGSHLHLKVECLACVCVCMHVVHPLPTHPPNHPVEAAILNWNHHVCVCMQTCPHGPPTHTHINPMPVSIKSLKWNNSFTNQGEFNFRHFLDMLIYDLPHQPVTGLLPTCVVSTGSQVIVGFSLTISRFGILGVSVCFVYCVLSIVWILTHFIELFSPCKSSQNSKCECAYLVQYNTIFSHWFMQF